MSGAVWYDESFSTLLDSMCEQCGAESIDRVVVLREAAGRLTLLYDGELGEERMRSLDRVLRDRLGPYAREDRVVADRSEAGVPRLLEEAPAQWLPYGERRVRCLDRRLIGADWLASPVPTAPGPPRFVFSSLKGGVGRSTALCIAAAELAQGQGQPRESNLLVIDLDLEAPGLGSLLIAPEQVPRYGVVDYLVERGLSIETEGLVREMIAPSILTQTRSGRVDVIPALGTATRPENYLGKLARALLDVGPGHETLPLRVKCTQLIQAATSLSSYDAVLIDARAGMAELTAGPLLGLGATVLLFGTAQRQTIEGYRTLFAHLASLVPPQTESPWRNLRAVLAKAPPERAQLEWYMEEMHALFQEYFYEELESEDLFGFNFGVDDSSAPHHPVPIAMNPLFAAWDPTRRPGDLDRSFYQASFAPLTAFLTQKIEERR